MSSHGSYDVINDDDSHDLSIYSDDTNDGAVLEVRKLLDSVHAFTIELLKRGVPDEKILDEQQKYLESQIRPLLNREHVYEYPN